VNAPNVAAGCLGRLHPQAREGLKLFNRRAYFEAHEALEHAWIAESSNLRDLYRGLLQAAVVYYHVERGNYAGAIKVFDRCLKWLRPWVPVCRGVHVDSVLEDLQVLIHEVRRLGPGRIVEIDSQYFKPVHWSEPDPSSGEGFLCDRCGQVMVTSNCRLTCPNCGNRFDCSDLSLYFG